MIREKRGFTEVASPAPTSAAYGSVKQASFWIIIAFCLLRSLEVLVFQRPLPYIQYLVTVSGAIFFVATLGSVTHLGRAKVSPSLGVSLLLFAIMLSSLFLQVIFHLNPADILGRRPHHMLGQQIFLAASWFFAGSAASMCRSVGKRWLNASLIFFLFLLVAHATSFGLSIPYADLQEQGGFLTLNHLLLSEYMLLICFFSYVFSPVVLRPLVMIITAYILFAGGGRASLLIGIGSLVIYEYLFSGRSMALVSVAIIALGVGVAAYLVDLSDPLFQYMLFSTGVDNDASSALRSEQFIAGLERLPHQVLFGESSFLVDRFNDLGYYIHNLLSAWQLFGVVVFFMLVGFLVRSASCLRWTMAHASTELDHFFAAVFIYATISALTVKYVGFSAMWYALGYWMLRRDRSRRSTTRTVGAL